MVYRRHTKIIRFRKFEERETEKDIPANPISEKPGAAKLITDKINLKAKGISKN